MIVAPMITLTANKRPNLIRTFAIQQRDSTWRIFELTNWVVNKMAVILHATFSPIFWREHVSHVHFIVLRSARPGLTLSDTKVTRNSAFRLIYDIFIPLSLKFVLKGHADNLGSGNDSVSSGNKSLHERDLCRHMWSPGHNEITYVSKLTHWGRVTHICVSKITTIGSDNGLSPGRRQAITRINAGYC